MRSPNRDEVIAVLIIRFADGLNTAEALEIIYGREVEPEELTLFGEAVRRHRHGWVAMDFTNRASRRAI